MTISLVWHVFGRRGIHPRIICDHLQIFWRHSKPPWCDEKEGLLGRAGVAMPNPPQNGNRVSSRFERQFRRRKMLFIHAGSDCICFWTLAVSGPALPRKLARAIGTTNILMENTVNTLTHEYTQERLKTKIAFSLWCRSYVLVFTQARQLRCNHSIRVNILLSIIPGLAIDHLVQFYYQSTSHDVNRIYICVTFDDRTHTHTHTSMHNI